MKRLLVVLMAVIFALAGCGQLEVDIKKDGSAEFTYTFEDYKEYYTASEIERQIENSVDEINNEFDKEIAKVKKLKDKDGVITAVVSIENEAFDGDGLMLAPVKDVYRYNPEALLSLEDKDGEKLTADDIKKYEDYLFFYMDNSSQMMDTIVNVPGKVVYTADDIKISKDNNNSVETDANDIALIYKNSGFSVFGLIIPIILIIVIAGVVFFLFRKFKGPKISKAFNGPQTVVKVEGGNPNA